MKTSQKKLIALYKRYYKSYHYLTKVEDYNLDFPGDLSESEIRDISRLKSSFAMGLYNTRDTLSTNSIIKAEKELKKEDYLTLK